MPHWGFEEPSESERVWGGLRKGGRPKYADKHGKEEEFQSTPPRGGRLPVRLLSRQKFCFNPRPHEGGDVWMLSVVAAVGCFNPRPHEGGDAFRHLVEEVRRVSIHAPTRGATCATADVVAVGFQVSIHAPTRGATYLRHLYACARSVSIHAPTRGATLIL